MKDTKDTDVMDKLFDELLKEAAKLVAVDRGNAFEDPGPVEFSEEHERRMRALFRRERYKLALRNAIKASRKVAVACLLVVAVFSITIFSVEAFRVRFLNFVVEMTHTHSKIDFKEGEKGDSYSSDEIDLGYIPKGFCLENSNVRNGKIQLKFIYDDMYFIFSTSGVDGGNALDTENANVIRLTVGGHEAMYSANSNGNFLIWHDEEFAYKILGNIAQNEMVKIAESVTK